MKTFTISFLAFLISQILFNTYAPYPFHALTENQRVALENKCLDLEIEKSACDHILN